MPDLHAGILRGPPLTSMMITSTCTLVGRGRSGWKRLARATRRCRVASRSLLKIPGRRRGHEVRAPGIPKPGATRWAPYCLYHPLQPEELGVQSSGEQRSGNLHAEPKNSLTCSGHPFCKYSPRARAMSGGNFHTQMFTAALFKQLNVLRQGPG